MMTTGVTSFKYVPAMSTKNLLRAFYNFLLILTFLFTASCLNTGMNDRVSDGLTVSSDGHSLMKNGKPFFWLGDTGWLILKETPENIDTYFGNRKKNGFNVIQIMVTRRMFNDEEFQPDYRGDLPFESLDPVKLNEEYFTHLDEVVKLAEKHDLFLAMVPFWGYNLDQVISADKPENAYELGRQLGKRYRNYSNIIWIVCGEYQLIAWDTVKNKPDSDPDDRELNLIDNLARGIENGSRGKSLMTIHPDSYRSSSEYLHDADWLDFNLVQSFTIREDTEFDIISDYRRMPYKPTLLSEPGYENGWGKHTAFELRYEGYHSVLNGGCGYTFGCEGIWTFREGWQKWLDSEGTLQMTHLRNLFESRPMMHRVPAPDLITGCPGDWVKRTKMAAAIDDGGAYAFVYFPADTIQAEIRISEISGKQAGASWFNPRDGKTYNNEGEVVKDPFALFPCDKNQRITFDPPGNNGLKHDWILILDDAEKNFQ